MEEHFSCAFAPPERGASFLKDTIMATKKLNLNKQLDPVRAAAQQEIWAREAVKNAKIPKVKVIDYVPSLHNNEPYYREGAKDAFKHPSLINGKRVPYWAEV